MKQSSKGDQAQSGSPSKYQKVNGYTVESSSTFGTRSWICYFNDRRRRAVLLFSYAITIATIMKSGRLMTSDSVEIIMANGTEVSSSIIPPIYEEDALYCEQNNIVLSRDDFLDNHHDAVRSWSVAPYLFNNNPHKVKKCNNLHEYLVSIRNGTRRWVQSSDELLPPLEAEEYPSYFVPYGCYLPFPSSHQLCSTLNKYSHIIFDGDSLSRHVTQAVLMILRKDLILGGIESTNKHGKDNPYQCKCDGQFSEHVKCRQNNGLFDAFTPRDLNLCSHLPEDDQFKFRYVDRNYGDRKYERVLDEIAQLCIKPQYKGAIWVLQGGLHHGTNAQNTMQKWIKPLMDNPTFKSCIELKKMEVVWVTYGAQSRQLDKKYPLQTRENAHTFNIAMESELKKHLPNITIIDWWGVTAEAQTSDGVHFLSDVNLFKASVVANVIEFLRY